MYIRTKDGVYDLENDDIVKIDGKYKECYVQKDTGDTCFKDIEILKVSENLEELCDEIVIEYADGSKIISIHDNTKEFLKEHKYELKSGYIKNVYGAIWTSKGLIYVAKMNENGELELI
jgi:hypothetical protein